MICFLAHIGKIKIISTYFNISFNRITTDLVKKKSPPFGNVGGKKTTQKSVFFLVAANFILSEESPNIEYSESALIKNLTATVTPLFYVKNAKISVHVESPYNFNIFF